MNIWVKIPQQQSREHLCPAAEMKEISLLEKPLGLGAPCLCARGNTLVNGMSALQTSALCFLPASLLLGVQAGTEGAGREQGASSWCGRPCSQVLGSGCWCSRPEMQISQRSLLWLQRQRRLHRWPGFTTSRRSWRRKRRSEFLRLKVSTLLAGGGGRWRNLRPAKGIEGAAGLQGCALGWFLPRAQSSAGAAGQVQGQPGTPGSAGPHGMRAQCDMGPFTS